MSELIHKGGPTMLMIIALVLPALVMVILHLVLARAWSAWISTGLLTLILAIGLYGTIQGRALTNRGVESLREASYRNELRAEGYKQASLPVKAAALVNGVLAIGVLIGELRRRKRYGNSPDSMRCGNDRP